MFGDADGTFASRSAETPETKIEKEQEIRQKSIQNRIGCAAKCSFQSKDNQEKSAVRDVY